MSQKGTYAICFQSKRASPGHLEVLHPVFPEDFSQSWDDSKLTPAALVRGRATRGAPAVDVLTIGAGPGGSCSFYQCYVRKIDWNAGWYTWVDFATMPWQVKILSGTKMRRPAKSMEWPG